MLSTCIKMLNNMIYIICYLFGVFAPLSAADAATNAAAATATARRQGPGRRKAPAVPLTGVGPA